MLNIHHLELFFYVARHGGISAALPHIPYGVQQPAVSAQIGQLEEYLGARLFERRPFALTRVGTMAYEFIAPFFSGLGGLESQLRSEPEQHLRVAASAIVLQSHLPALLQRLGLQPPELRLALREATQAQAQTLLIQQEVELALVAFDSPPKGLQSEVLLKIQPQLVVPVSDSAKNAAAVLKRGELHLVAMAEKFQPSRSVLAELDRRGVVWNLGVETGSLDLVDTYVGAGHGVGISLSVPNRQPLAGVRHLPLTGFPLIQFGALWKGRLGPLATKLLAVAKAYIRELGATR
jgi:DNA-binding transcriptional LysR family regulator